MDYIHLPEGARVTRVTFEVPGAWEGLDELHVEDRGDSSYAILYAGGAWTRNRFGFNPEPSARHRTAEYLNSARWTLEEAIVEVQAHALPHATRWWADWVAKGLRYG